MSQSSAPHSEVATVVAALLASYRADARAQHIDKRFLPSREEIIACVQILLQLFYPGYYGRQDLDGSSVEYHVGVLVTTLRDKLEREIENCMCFDGESAGNGADVPRCHKRSRELAGTFLGRIPEIRRKLILDVQAAFDGDPAAKNLDEIILAYPGLLAISVYRIAHELHGLGVPLMPRIMSEWAHAQTGADIHPGATIGESFFIDHATGVVIGETSTIGARVKLYQGVTLGAISHPRDAEGRVVRGQKRHPTVEDDVTVYANATVLGGATVLGKGSIVGGSVFVTKSVPAGNRVALEAPRLRVAHEATAASAEPEF